MGCKDKEKERIKYKSPILNGKKDLLFGSKPAN